MASNTTKKDMLVLYNGTDAEEWRNYLWGLIGVGLGESIQCDWEDIRNGVPENIMSLYGNMYRLLTVFVSPLMLDTMELDTHYLKPFVNAHDNIAVIRLYTSKTDLESVIKDGYSRTEHWTVLEVTSETTDNEKMVSQLMDRLQLARAPPKLKPKPSKPKKGHSPSEKKLASNIVKTICPEQIKTDGEPVILVLHKAYEQETIQVAFDKDTHQKDTTRLNPYCFQFKAPAHRPGHVSMYVYVDGVKKCKVILKYMRHSIFAYTNPEYISQLLNIDTEVDKKDLHQLDKTLAEIYTSSTPGDSSLAHILSPRNVVEASGGRKSEDFLPTLLHFACYYGLQELCSCVMDTPGSAVAFEVRNCDDKNPLDLARENQHEGLADYVEIFLEMQDYVEVCGDIYEKMTKQTLEDGYLYMKGNRDVDEAYDQGRIPNDEDDYILADAPSQIQEVTEDEDITAKPKVPDRKHRPTENVTQTQPVPPARPPPLTKAVTGPAFLRDDAFFEPIPLSPNAMGSTNLAELIDYQDMYKRKELDLGDIERLYEAWTERNRNHLTSSVKERKATMEKLKNEFYKPLRPKPTHKSASEVPALEIKHNVVPNKYADWKPCGVPAYGQRDSYGSNRDSTTSSSSCGSRDSALGAIREYSDSDSEEVAPPVPYRDGRETSSAMSEKRHSLGKTFLDNITSSAKVSRLPPVPSIHPPVRMSQSSTPSVPPRPPIPQGRRKISN